MNFQKDVLDKSHARPVLVDFWAEWCGPCRVLTPVLDALSQEDDRWELVKLNTEEYPEIAQEYQVRSIPNVKLFHSGKVVGEFVGALPRTEIVKWLDENIPSEEKEAWSELKDSEGEWPDNVFAKILGEFVREHPGHLEAQLDRAKHSVLREPELALEILDTHSLMQLSADTVSDIRTLAELLLMAPEESGPLKPAIEMLRQQDMPGAVDVFTQVAMTDKGFHNNLPQRAGVATFRLLGPGNPVTRAKRKLFDMALY